MCKAATCAPAAMRTILTVLLGIMTGLLCRLAVLSVTSCLTDLRSDKLTKVRHLHTGTLLEPVIAKTLIDGCGAWCTAAQHATAPRVAMTK